MKIAVYNIKGWAGKSPVSANIALDKDFAVGTNEPYHVYDSLIDERSLISIGLNDEFPLFGSDVDIVFDLAGSISTTSLSITSAIKQSDVVIVPIYNEVKAITAGLHTIAEVSKFNSNIIVVATKLQRRGKHDIFTDWAKCEDMKNIERVIHSQIAKHVPVLPLKYSSVFDTIFEQEKSIHQLMQSGWLNAYHYKEVNKQFDAIYNLINDYAK